MPKQTQSTDGKQPDINAANAQPAPKADAPQTQGNPDAGKAAEGPVSLTIDFAVESVLPTGGGRDTSTIVLRPATNSENNGNFFRQAGGRISLSDVREEVAAQFRFAHQAKITFEPVGDSRKDKEPVY